MSFTRRDCRCASKRRNFATCSNTWAALKPSARRHAPECMERPGSGANWTRGIANVIADSLGISMAWWHGDFLSLRAFKFVTGVPFYSVCVHTTERSSKVAPLQHKELVGQGESSYVTRVPLGDLPIVMVFRSKNVGSVNAKHC
eukprot:2067680-Amphidinium_carterae.1